MSLLRYAWSKCSQELIEQSTDESSLIELIGKKVQVVDGDISNIKITNKEDLQFLNKLI